MLFSPPGPTVGGFNAAEVMNFLFGVIGAAVLLEFHRRGRLPPLRYMYSAYALLMASYASTILEGFAWWGLFNLAEHVCLALSGIAFALALLDLSRPALPGGGGSPGA